MILLDTNILIYGFQADSLYHHWAKAVIRDALLGQGAAVNPVILTELCVGDDSPGSVAPRLEVLGIRLLDLPAGVSHRCALAYASYLGERRRQSNALAPKCPLPDFFIGAHASILELPLATADTSRYQIYFPEVQLLTPPP